MLLIFNIASLILNPSLQLAKSGGCVKSHRKESEIRASGDHKISHSETPLQSKVRQGAPCPSTSLSDLQEGKTSKALLHLLSETGFPLSSHKHNADQIKSVLAHWAFVRLFSSSWFDDAYQEFRKKYACPFPYIEAGNIASGQAF